LEPLLLLSVVVVAAAAAAAAVITDLFPFYEPHLFSTT